MAVTCAHGIPSGTKYIACGLLVVTMLACSKLLRMRGDMGSSLLQIGSMEISAPHKRITERRRDLDVNNVCPASTRINSVNDHQPYSTLMHLGEIRSVLKSWYGLTCARGGTTASCNFNSIGQHLLHHATRHNQTLLTVQVGAMDGKSNDPFYEMFASNRFHYVRAPFTDLRNWLPVMIEPVPTNYEALLKTYTHISKTKGLGCAVPINAAVSYNASKTTCPFCRFNTATDAPKQCTKQPDWMKFQIGTLDCGYSK